MSKKVQWRPQLNALTTPPSYKAQPVPKDFLGYDEIAELISLKNPVWTPGLIKSILLEERKAIREELINGNQISYENTCTWHLSLESADHGSFTPCLDSSDQPWPSWRRQ